MSHKRRLESEVVDLYRAPRPRAKRRNHELLRALERALRRVQEATSNITVVGMSDEDPVSYRIGDDAYAQTEELRRRISRAIS
jgi:hypothetical protein